MSLALLRPTFHFNLIVFWTFIYLFKTVIILYPPFTVFTVVHTLFLKNKAEYFPQRASLKKGSIRVGGE